MPQEAALLMTDIKQRFFAVAGNCIAVRATNNKDLENFDATLEGLQSAAPAMPDFVIDIREASALDEADIGGGGCGGRPGRPASNRNSPVQIGHIGVRAIESG